MRMSSYCCVPEWREGQQGARREGEQSAKSLGLIGGGQEVVKEIAYFVERAEEEARLASFERGGGR